MAAILLIVGAPLVVIGVAFIYWPAAFVVAGILCITLAALFDLSAVETTVHDAFEDS